MKFVVVRRFQHPLDKAKKTNRYAVVLGLVDGRLVVAPCTTYPERTHTVPRGSALITRLSESFESSGFLADAVAISIRDAALYNIDSRYVRRCQQVGVLDVELDKHLRDNLRELMKEYNLATLSRSFVG